MRDNDAMKVLPKKKTKSDEIKDLISVRVWLRGKKRDITVKVKLEVFMGFATCPCYLKCFHMTAHDDNDDDDDDDDDDDNDVYDVYDTHDNIYDKSLKRLLDLSIVHVIANAVNEYIYIIHSC